MASSTGKRGAPRWAKWVAIAAGVALVAGVVAIAGMAVAAVGPVPPEPPTDVHVAVTPGPSDQVNFTPPTSDGGDAITGYTATCTSHDGGAAKTGTSPTSPVTVSGLTYGKTYTCAVTATSKDGESVPSQESNPFVPIAVPNAPGPVSAVPYGPGTAKVVWTAPSSNGGATITAYKITPYQGSTAQNARTFNSPSTQQQVNGLLVGRSYSFTIAAVNAAGTGTVSAKTEPIVMGTPGQPGSVKVTRASAGVLRVTYAAPANNGATITSYTAGCNSSNGGVDRTQTTTAPPTPINVGSLTAGKTYTCVVKATNSRGTGPKSSPTAAVTA